MMGITECEGRGPARAPVMGKESGAQTQLYLGYQLAERGGTEGAIRAFSAALAATLKSQEPGDLRLRRIAAFELVRLMREGEVQWGRTP